MTLIPCSSCGSPARPGAACPHCGARAAASPSRGTLAVLLLGLTGSCGPFLQADYGVMVTDVATDHESGTVTTGCASVEDQGTTYDCTQLDLCAETDVHYRLACCDCDPTYCDSTCVSSGDTGTP